MKHENTKPEKLKRRSVVDGGKSAMKPGFTIIEILIVIMILGILLALGGGLASYMSEQADMKATVASQQIIMDAVRAYTDDTLQLPDVGNDIRALYTALSANYEAKQILRSLKEDAIDKQHGSFLDSFGNEMEYKPEGGFGDKPVIISAGIDGDLTQTQDNIRSDEH